MLFGTSEESIDVNAECTLVNAMAYLLSERRICMLAKSQDECHNVAARCGLNRLVYVTFCPRLWSNGKAPVSCDCRFTVLSHSIVLSLK